MHVLLDAESDMDYYEIITNKNDYWDMIIETANMGFDIVAIETPPSFPCLIELFKRGEKTTYRYTEVCDLEGCNQIYYVDEDPEFSVLLSVAREMLFLKIEDNYNASI